MQRVCHSPPNPVAFHVMRVEDRRGCMCDHALAKTRSSMQCKSRAQDLFGRSHKIERGHMGKAK